MASFRLLAGPVLRRAEPQRICIWIVTDAPVHSRAQVLQLPEPYAPGDSLVVLGQSGDEPAGMTTVRLGERLYVTLLQAFPQGDAFPQDRLLAYDLMLDGRSLADLGLLSGPGSLAYEGLPLPTFFLGSRMSCLLHASCRNLGGSGLDALPCGDELIARHPLNLNLRPSILILDGDQIYADHLPSPLIRHLTRLGNELMGWEEAIPGIPDRLADIPVDGRAELAIRQAGFTSGGAQNQLMGLGEYAALYLVAWNQDNWPETLPPFVTAEPPAGIPPLSQVSKAARQALGLVVKTPEQAYEGMVRNLETVHTMVPAVRRLLANIPSYMMFDDHDTTDDLFITRHWKETVWASPTGRRIVANGLAAAWAFQCWGNDPDLYPESFIDTICTHLQHRAADPSAAQAYEHTLWHFPDWCFHVPVQPATIVMNTRTQRGYDSDEGAARLLNEQGLQAMGRAATRAGYRHGDPLILVSPTPVVGYETVEGMQELVSRYVGAYRFDLESWRANIEGYLALFKFLIAELEPRYVVFLAGDVHYGFTISAAFTWQGNTLPVVQLTSSALKNTGLALRVMELGSGIAGRTDRHLGWGSLAEDVEEAEPALAAEGRADAALGAAIPNVAQARGRSVHVVRGQTTQMPANLPARSGLLQPSQVPAKGQPDWQDTRTFEPTWGYRSEPIIGENNLGLVRFRSGNLLVHRLLIPTKDGTRSSTAIVATVPGKLVLKPVGDEVAKPKP
jgi:hypothetical protein